MSAGPRRLTEDEGRLRLAMALSEAESEPDVTAAATSWASAAAGAVFANLAVFDHLTNTVRVAHADSLESAIAERWATFPIDTPTPLCEAILTGYPVLLPDLDAIALRYPGLLADTVAAGLEATASIPLRGSNGSSIGAMGFAWSEPQVFTQRQTSRLSLVAELAAQALERAQTEIPVEPHRRPRPAVSSLQETILPSHLPDLDGLEVAAAYLPANHAPMGGDWYDAFPVEGGACLVIGDVAGHGLDAASVMAELRYAIRAYAADDPVPEHIVSRTNRMLCRYRPDDTATVIVGVWEAASRALRRCNAGHPPILRCRFDEFGFLPLTGCAQPLLGVDPDFAYRHEDKELRAGTTLLLYTDGLIEVPGEHLDRGLGRLLDFVAHQPDLAPQTLLDETLLWRLRQGPCLDDLGLLAVRLE